MFSKLSLEITSLLCKWKHFEGGRRFKCVVGIIFKLFYLCVSKQLSSAFTLMLNVLLSIVEDFGAFG